MRLKKHQRSIKVPPIGQLLSVTWSEQPTGENDYTVWLVSPQEIEARLGSETETTHGQPAFCSLVGENLIVFPLPDRDGVLRVRYYPPMREA